MFCTQTHTTSLSLPSFRRRLGTCQFSSHLFTIQILWAAVGCEPLETWLALVMATSPGCTWTNYSHNFIERLKYSEQGVLEQLVECHARKKRCLLTASTLPLLNDRLIPVIWTLTISTFPKAGLLKRQLWAFKVWIDEFTCTSARMGFSFVYKILFNVFDFHQQISAGLNYTLSAHYAQQHNRKTKRTCHHAQTDLLYEQHVCEWVSMNKTKNK